MTKRTRLALLLCFIAFTACSYGAFRIGVVVFAKYGLFKELVAAACKEMAGCVRADVFSKGFARLPVYWGEGPHAAQQAWGREKDIECRSDQGKHRELRGNRPLSVAWLS